MDNTGIFRNAYDDEDVEEEVDMNNVISSYTFPNTSFTKFHKDHHEDQVIGSLKTPVQTRHMTKINEEHAGLLTPASSARFQVTPKTSHFNVVKRIFRYLKGQPKLGLWYLRDSPFNLEAFSDSDYAGASLDMKSTTRCCQFLGKRLISWQCVMDPKSYA
ncbi:hypothetical protein Tco_1493831 [Tanacetum coccineum]